MVLTALSFVRSISGLVVEYIVAIDVTRARFPADASCLEINGFAVSQLRCSKSAGPSTRKDRAEITTNRLSSDRISRKRHTLSKDFQKDNLIP